MLRSRLVPALLAVLLAGPLAADSSAGAPRLLRQPTISADAVVFVFAGDLWSAQLLVDAPDAIVEAHRAFFTAGSEVATTASYQATFDGFGAHGIDRETTASLMRRSVALARQAAGRRPA